MKFTVIKSPNAKKKWRAVFTAEDGTEMHTDFGDATMRDFTQHKDPARKALYLARHRSRESWNDPKTAGALSRWILWSTPDFHQAVSQFRRRFHLSS